MELCVVGNKTERDDDEVRASNNFSPSESHMSHESRANRADYADNEPLLNDSRQQVDDCETGNFSTSRAIILNSVSIFVCVCSLASLFPVGKNQ